jgi:hypothetical protein
MKQRIYYAATTSNPSTVFSSGLIPFPHFDLYQGKLEENCLLVQCYPNILGLNLSYFYILVMICTINHMIMLKKHQLHTDYTPPPTCGEIHPNILGSKLSYFYILVVIYRINHIIMLKKHQLHTDYTPLSHMGDAHQI